MVAQQVAESSSGNSREDLVETTKSLVCALNYISRNLPLPPHLFAAVSSIYHGASPSLSPPPPSPPGNNFTPFGSDLMSEFEDELSKQRTNFESGTRLAELQDNRNKTHILRRLSELEELPSTRGDDLQGKCLLELYGLKLRELQGKVRTEVSSEFWLRMNCTDVSTQLFEANGP